MCQAVARHLRPGGRFVTVNNNPEYTGHADSMRKYGFERHINERHEGAPVTWQFFLDDNIFAITNYYLSIAAHERVLKAAGLRNIAWRAPEVSPPGVAEFGEEFWRVFLEHPPIIFLESERT